MENKAYIHSNKINLVCDIFVSWVGWDYLNEESNLNIQFKVFEITWKNRTRWLIELKKNKVGTWEWLKCWNNHFVVVLRQESKVHSLILLKNITGLRKVKETTK